MENQKRKKQLIVSTVLLLSLVLITVGISYAFFTYIGNGSTENTITTGNLTFIYDEKNQSGNGIKLSNAYPISDDIGKSQTGSNNVFEFQVIATTQGAPIYYEILAEKGEGSTLAEEVTKVYLTTVDGIEETEVDNTLINGQVATFDQLPVSQIPKHETNKTLYQGTISEGQTKFTQQFKLRMWLSEEATGQTDGEWSYGGKIFTLKVNVYASNDMLPEPTKSKTVPNAPELVQGMIPVIYEGNKWVKADTSSKWYDYNQQEWANAVTVTETSRTKYMDAEAGTEILMNDINTMWVWIPRYEYKYTNLGNQYAGGSKEQPGAIKVNFIEGTKTTSSDKSNYKVHPAFTFGEEELTGIWYAKFEVAGTLITPCVDINCDVSQITIKPGLASLRNQSNSSFFYAARSMQLNTSNIFGFSSSSGDLHMSKNSEWGAVAYLSQSKYGKYGNPNYVGANKEIYQNKSSEYITGSSNGTPSTSATNEQVTYDTPDTGYGASTTGTIYGIYDMSGGAWERVMGNYNNTIRYAGFSKMPESKYYDLYTSNNALTACNGEICYGHALSETSNWYFGDKVFIHIYNPWMARGGLYKDNKRAVIFNYNVNDGSSINGNSSRFAITP